MEKKNSRDAVVLANTKFGHELHKLLASARNNENLANSPFSLSTLLAMVKLGCRGHTGIEIQRACNFPIGEHDTTLGSGYKQLLQILQGEGGPDQGYELAAANSLYVAKGYPLQPQFSSTLQDFFLIGELQRLDFSEAMDAASKIDDWVEAVTKSKITNLIAPTMLGPSTRLLLVNAIYFKGLWEIQFNKSDTTKEMFHAIDAKGKERKVQVDMIKLKKCFSYTKIENAQVIELPYKGEQASMLVFLPKKRDGLTKLRVEPIDLDSLLKRMRRENVILSLPRFRIETSHELIEPLKKLGIKSLFEPGQADLTRVSGEKGLYVSNAVQKVFVEVTEEGTEATEPHAGMVIRYRCAGAKPEFVTFTADHPFMFQIIHKPTGLLLFSGSVTNPAAN